MKYWRGYLVAAIFTFITWGLAEFSKAHWELVDMVYPYVTRLIQNYLANWSSGVPFTIWQLMLIIAGVLVLASIVLMVIFKWNPIQWFGWVVAAASVVLFLNTAIYGLNDYAGPLAQDIRLEITDYSLEELEEAAVFYQEEANKLAGQVSRSPDGALNYPGLEELSVQAAEGFENQTYLRFNSVFAGEVIPVKALSWEGLFSSRGITGITFGLTGESSVNPQTPAVAMPYVICREMAKRMCIANEQDASFAAFMACDANSNPEFRYAAYFMAYRYCYNAIADMDNSAAKASATKLAKSENSKLKQDLDSYNASFAAKLDDNYPSDNSGYSVTDLLVSWHIQEYILPSLVEEEVLFDPMDETQVDLTGLPNAG